MMEGAVESTHEYRMAEGYERYVVPYLVAPFIPDFIKLADLQPEERVLDVACGTGVATRLAAQHVGVLGQVMALDTNPAMIAVARRLPPPPGGNITYMECSAEAIYQANDIFDVVLCHQGLQFISDKTAALVEMHRVLRPGGRLVLSVWKKGNPYNKALYKAVERYINPETAAGMRTATNLGDTEALERLLSHTEFEEINVRTQMRAVHLPPVREYLLEQWASMPIADLADGLSEQVQAKLVKDIESAVKPYADKNGVTFPNEVNIATAVKKTSRNIEALSLLHNSEKYEFLFKTKDGLNL